MITRSQALVGFAQLMAVCCLAQPAPRGPLVGAIRWDAWYGTLPENARPPASVPYPGFDPARNRLVSQDPGQETCRSLVAEPWRYRWPFFTELGADGRAQAFNENRAEVLEKEIDQAISGGLDYWAFTAYPEPSPLSYTLKTFLSCKNRDKIRFCLYLPMWPAYGRMPDDEAERAYWAYAARLVAQPNYLRVEGNRPVVFAGFFNDALTTRVAEGPWAGFTNALARSGLGKPYLVICEGSPAFAKRVCDRLGGDALSAYAVSDGKAKGAPFAELAAYAERFWARCEATGTPAVPLCMTGWDRRTRVMNPVSWESFHTQKDADQYFYQRGTADELAAHIGRGVSWYRQHPGKNGTELVLVYAWNEFDEGGWLVPALPPPHGEGTARLDALRKVLRENNPLIPMGAITGKPDEQTVRETLEAFKSVGIDQYLIYARSGLEYEYMGEEWLQMCERFCKHAKRLDMALWLYDEYNWPSGSCKGKVPAEDPDYESRQYAVYRNADGTYDWKVCHSPGWVDNTSFKAMERFIELTHKKYEQRLGLYMGSTIAGIFTDEPSHPTPVKLAGKPALLFRYFDGAEAEYKAATGRELRADVQDFLANSAKDEVWAVYYGLLGERFRKAYFDPIRAWCDHVGILSTGHMIAENDSCSSALYNGRPLHALKGLTLPGMDEIGTRCDPASIEWLTLAVAQHAVGRRGNGGLAELFALGPSDMSHAAQRQMVWLCALHKMDRYLLAISPLDARGNVEKAGYFNPLTPMQPWFPALRLLGNEARLAARYANKPVTCDIAVRYPQREAARLAAKRKPHPALLAALRRFSAHQLTYDLFEEDEPCDKPLVFAFDGAAIKEEKSGRTFASPDEAAAFAKTVCPPAAWVETADGKADEELLLRHYQDGSVAVLGLGAREHGRLRLMRRSCGPVPFELPARGVFCFEGKAPAPHAPGAVRPVVASAAYGIARSAANTFRLAFGTNGTARIKVDQPIEDARIVVRNHPVPSSVAMDGQPVQAVQPCNALRPGLDELYRQTAPFRLETGEHAFAITAGGSDTNYFLPVAFVTGDFAVRERAVTSMPKTVGVGALWRQGLGGYAGSVTYATQVEVPAGPAGLSLRLNTGGLYTAVTLDGQALGERAWAPFLWSVPERARGRTAELCITVWTSVAPLFGDWKEAGSAWSKKFWVPPPEPHPEVGLLASPEWVFDDETCVGVQ